MTSGRLDTDLRICAILSSGHIVSNMKVLTYPLADFEDLVGALGLCEGQCLEESDYAQECSKVEITPVGGEDSYTDFSDIT